MEDLPPIDKVQPKTYPFSTRHLIWVNYKFVSQLYQPIFDSFSYLNIARQKFRHWIVSCTKNILIFVLRLFSELTYSLVAIELLAFSKIQNSIFIDQEISRNLGFKKKSLLKKDWFLFLFVTIKTSHRKNPFVHKYK